MDSDIFLWFFLLFVLHSEDLSWSVLNNSEWGLVTNMQRSEELKEAKVARWETRVPISICQLCEGPSQEHILKAKQHALTPLML